VEEVDEEEAERCTGLKKEGNLRELCLCELALRQMKKSIMIKKRTKTTRINAS
jgi:hypothetical protein